MAELLQRKLDKKLWELENQILHEEKVLEQDTVVIRPGQKPRQDIGVAESGNMETQTIETNELIARRVPPGDKWVLVDDKTQQVHESLTDALEAWFAKTNKKVELHIEEEVKPQPTKRYDIYGDPI